MAPEPWPASVQPGGNQPGEAATELALGRTCSGPRSRQSQERSGCGPEPAASPQLCGHWKRPACSVRGQRAWDAADRLPVRCSNRPVQPARIESGEGWQSGAEAAGQPIPASWSCSGNLPAHCCLEQAVGGAAGFVRRLRRKGLPDPRPRAAGSGLRLPSSARVRARLARRRWQDSVCAPPGVYGWRPSEALGQEGKRSLPCSQTVEPTRAMEPLRLATLQSGEARLDQLSGGLGQPLESLGIVGDNQRGDTEHQPGNCSVLEGGCVRGRR